MRGLFPERGPIASYRAAWRAKRDNAPAHDQICANIEAAMWNVWLAVLLTCVAILLRVYR